MQISIQAGNPRQVQLTGQDYLLPFVRLTVKDGELLVGLSRPIRRKGTRAVEVILYQNRLTRIQIREAAAVSSAVLLGEAPLSLDLDEASSLSAPLAADTLSVTLAGSSVAKLRGAVVAASLRVSGSSQLTADSLRISRVQANIMGSSQASLTVLHALSIRASGDSSFLYGGHPTLTQLVSEQATVKPKMDRQP